MGLGHKGTGTLCIWNIMGMVYNGTGIQLASYIGNPIGTQWDWETMDLLHSGNGTQLYWYVQNEIGT